MIKKIFLFLFCIVIINLGCGLFSSRESQRQFIDVSFYACWECPAFLLGEHFQARQISPSSEYEIVVRVSAEREDAFEKALDYIEAARERHQEFLENDYDFSNHSRFDYYDEEWEHFKIFLFSHLKAEQEYEVIQYTRNGYDVLHDEYKIMSGGEIVRHFENGEAIAHFDSRLPYRLEINTDVFCYKEAYLEATGTED